MNAKELVLKKINADTNWVDIYTISFILGESLESIGDLMLDPDITELINNYSSSIFSDTQNSNKIKYIQSTIEDVGDSNSIKAKKYRELLNKVTATEEVRILGKMLKINQGLPTNTVELYTYIKSIEKFVESKYNGFLIKQVDKLRTRIIKARKSKDSSKLNRFIDSYEKSTPEMGKDRKLIELIKFIKDSGYKQININNDDEYQNLLQLISSYVNSNWESFNLIKFIEDPEYKQESIDKYEHKKIHFNILEVIESIPHFKEMFNVLSINKQVLNTLSVRNKLEDIIWNQSLHYPKLKNGNRSSIGTKTEALDKSELYELKDSIDQYIINSWIISSNISINMMPNQSRPAAQELHLNSSDNIDKFRSYVELEIIPLLKEKLPNNKFISLLTLGVKGDTTFYKLPFNMTQIDNNTKTKSLYEQVLADFNNLNNYEISELGMNLVDLFYLYNLIVNKDKFGSTSLTRIFEDLISSAKGDRLLVNDFNNWIDKQDPDKLSKLYYSQSITRNSNHVDDIEEAIIVEADTNEDDSSIGFKESNNIEVEGKPVIQQFDELDLQNLAEIWSKKEGWSVEYFNEKVLPRLNEAWQIEYVVSDDQKSPAVGANMVFSYNGKQRPEVKAKTTLEAIKLGERTATTRYESDGHIEEFWKKFKIGDRIKFKSGNDFVVVEVTKPLTKLVKSKDNNSTKQLNLFTGYYDTQPSTESKLIALIETANIPGLHLVYDKDLVNEESNVRNAKGFIRNGEVYINVDRATDDTVIHEFGHLYLADAKLQHPEEYYQLLARVKETDTWARMRQMSEYDNKRGSDFDEEVLATILSYPFNTNELENSIVEETMNLVSPEYKDLINSNILPVFTDTFISENYKEQQRLATIKNRLIKDNIIKEDCK